MLPVLAALNSKLELEFVVVITLSSNCMSVLNSTISRATSLLTVIASTFRELTVKLVSICTLLLNSISPSEAPNSKLEFDNVVWNIFPATSMSPKLTSSSVTRVPMVRLPSRLYTPFCILFPTCVKNKKEWKIDRIWKNFGAEEFSQCSSSL